MLLRLHNRFTPPNPNPNPNPQKGDPVGNSFSTVATSANFPAQHYANFCKDLDTRTPAPLPPSR